MMPSAYMDAFKQASENVREAKTKSEAELQTAVDAWWRVVIDAFNDEIAGEVTLVNGQHITIPKIEI